MRNRFLHAHRGLACTALLALALQPTGTAQRPGLPDAPSWDTGSAFVPNRGQWPTDARYLARFGSSVAVALEDRGFRVWVFDPDEDTGVVRGAGLAFRFVGADGAEMVPGERLAGVESFLGADRDAWRTHVPRFGRVRCDGLYDGVDVLAYGVDGHFEYDVIVAPGASLGQVELEVDGAEGLRVDADGDLIVETAAGDVRQPRPRTWQVEADGRRTVVQCNYELRGERRFGFVAPERDATAELVIDPGIVYSTYLSNWTPRSVFEGPNGIITLVGAVGANIPFQVVGGFIQNGTGGFEAIVAQFDTSLPAAQQLVYSSYVAAGRGQDVGVSVQVDANGVITLAGTTAWDRLPVTPGAFQTTYRGGISFPADGFVMQIDPSRSGPAQVVYATYLGGTEYEEVWRVRVDPAGRIIVCGATFSADFPISANAYDPVFDGTGSSPSDGYVTILDPSQQGSAQLAYSTFLGGRTGREQLRDALFDPVSGDLLIGLWTSSSDLPTTPSAFSATFGGVWDYYLARLDLGATPPSQQLLAATYLGGSGMEDQNFRIGTGPSGNVILAGSSASSDFPTVPGGFDPTHNGGLDAVVVQLDGGLTAMQYMTFLGGSNDDRNHDAFIEAGGAVILCGETNSLDFPTTPGAWDRQYQGGPSDGFVAHVDPALTPTQQVTYSTLLGGSNSDHCRSVHKRPGGDPVVGGHTDSRDFPTTSDAYQSGYPSTSRATFVARIDLTPFPPPTLTSISPTTVTNYPLAEVTLTGTFLSRPMYVTVGGQRIQGVTVDSDTQIRFRPSSALTIGVSHPVTVTTTTATSNALNLSVGPKHPAALAAPTNAFRGSPVGYSVFGDSGWHAILFVSPSNAPSVLPGIVSLGIGNGFSILIDAGTYVNDARGTSSTSIIYPTSLPSGFWVHAQVVTYDPANLTVPLETSNVASTLLF